MVAPKGVAVTILGTAQDGGVPQPGCMLPCCRTENGEARRVRHPVALGLTDATGTRHLFEASRALAGQDELWGKADGRDLTSLRSLWLTHGHLGHIDGLGLFGCEAMAMKDIELFCSQSMLELLKNSPTLNRLLTDNNLIPTTFDSGETIQTIGFSVETLLVPHRDDHTDTHAFIIGGDDSSLLFLPDHDSWGETLQLHSCDNPRQWFSRLGVDVVLIDGTFWSEQEVGGRAASIGHPPVSQTIELLGERREGDPRVIFIHLNHSNPLHDKNSEEYAALVKLGWEIAEQGTTFTL